MLSKSEAIRARWARVVQGLIALDVGFLGAAFCIGLARNIDKDTYGRLFGFAEWFSDRIAGTRFGFAMQQAAVGFLLAVAMYAALSWARSRRLSDRGLFLLGGAVAAVTPWLSLGLAGGALPKTPGDFLICGAILLAVYLNARGLRLIERKLWNQNRVGIVMGGLAIALLWMSLVSLASGLEKLTLWGSFIVSLFVALTSAHWYLSASGSLSSPTSA